MSGRRSFFCAAAAALFALEARAQSIRGIVVDPADRPVSGVVVLLVDSAAHVAARALSNERGEFRLAAPQAGAYRLRTLRIGFRPLLSDAVLLRSGGELTQRLVVSGLPLALDTMRVVDRNVCRAFTDSGAATYAVWEQIRTVLIAAELTAASRTISATTITYERTLDPGPGRSTGRILRQTSKISTDYVTQPWRTLAPETLRRGGYVVTERDNSIVYYAPGLDMLLSNAFIEDHCFRLTMDRRRKDIVGIAFEPIPERKRPAEIRGTLWVDRASSELRRLELRYVNVTLEQEEHAGADLEFVRMRDGTWAISRWNIRMPVVVQVVRPGQLAELRVSELRSAGGELAVARRASDTLWTRSPMDLAGALHDSLSGSPVANARIAIVGTALQATSDARGRFTIPGMLPGQYTLEVRTASLDSMNAVHRLPFTFIDSVAALEAGVPTAHQIAETLCGPAANREGAVGIVLGSVRFRDSTTTRTVRGLKVIAEWNVDPADSTRVRRLEVAGAPDGGFRLCGVPVNTTLRVRASGDSVETGQSMVVRISPGTRVARLELTLDRMNGVASRGATFSGVVVTDSTREPIVGAEVALPDLGKGVTTDSHGAFNIGGIPAGEQRVLVRRIGYGAADTRVTFNEHETVERRVVLGRAVTLETVTVSEKMIERQMKDFEDNRRLGLGHFMTRVELAKYDGMKLAGVLQQLSDVDFVQGVTGSAWIMSRRAPASLCPPGSPGEPPNLTRTGQCLQNHGVYIPERSEVRQGLKVGCYALVYLDGMLMNGTKEPTEPFDVNTIAPEQIEAVEFYSGPSQTPLKYSRMGSNCGVLVLWRRRSP